MRIARFCGLMPPSAWDACSAEDKGEMTKFYLTEQAMEQFENDNPPRQR